ncbi:MAG: hypothetical protein ACLFQV_03445 [Vulcanimicrobiota bacterium]
MNSAIILAVLFLIIFSNTSFAYAYIDPGSSSILYQLFYLAFYGILAAVGIFFRPIKNFVLKMMGKEPADEKTEPETDEEESEEDEDIEEPETN